MNRCVTNILTKSLQSSSRKENDYLLFKELNCKTFAMHSSIEGNRFTKDNKEI